MSEHTKEPWEFYVDKENNRCLIILDHLDIGEIYTPEDARRIVACVNKCEGVSTENLENNVPVLELARRYNVVIKQRDKLLEALKRMHSMHELMMIKVNHSASFYDEKCISEMNKAPVQALKLIAEIEEQNKSVSKD